MSNRAVVEGNPPSTVLAVYGTLRPGEQNHYLVRGIAGEWSEGTVRGYLFEVTWGMAEGYPGVAFADDGADVPVAVLESDRLPKHWHELDEFEGPGYRRIEVTVTRADGSTVQASAYEPLTDND